MAQDQPKLSEEQATGIGTEAYLFGYPLITLEMTRRVMTNTATPVGMRAPVGQFTHVRRYPPITYRDVPGANADTLYSAAWLDFAKEPYILSIPDAEGRYFMMPMLDAWSDVFEVPGTRTTGTEAQTYAITGPNWKGELSRGVTRYRSPTNMVWILGRTYCSATADDYEKVNFFQDRLSLVPLSAYGKKYTPPKGKVDPDFGMKSSTQNQVTGMDAAAYFKLLAMLMKDNPPKAADASMVAQMAKIGLVPGNDWDIGMLDPTAARELEKAPKAALAKMLAHGNRGQSYFLIFNTFLIVPNSLFSSSFAKRLRTLFTAPDTLHPWLRS